MLGYVSVSKDQLSEAELEIYRGYYCGVCKSMARYGQVPRFALSYDSVFLALLLASLDDGKEEITEEHCIIHHIKKNPVVRKSDAIDYAADILLLLAYYNFLDDKKDEHRLRGTVGETFFKKAYRIVKARYPHVAEEIEEGIAALSKLEEEKSPSLDMTADAFGRVLRSVFIGYMGYNDDAEKRVIGELAYNLGQWIYVMDAVDDLEKDRKSGAYNPLIYREGGSEDLEDTLYNYLGRVSAAIDLLDIKKNKGIIDNVVLLGLRGRTVSLLNKDSDKDLDKDSSKEE